MKAKNIAALLLMATALLTTACEGETNCPLSTQSVARFDFCDSQTHKGVTLTQGATITGIATIADTLHVDTLFNQATQYMTLPLSFTDKTTYVMHYTPLMRDTIEVTHRNIPFVSDIECGAMMHYHVENIRFTTNALDSVTIVNPQITNEETTNFYIYYRAADAG